MFKENNVKIMGKVKRLTERLLSPKSDVWPKWVYASIHTFLLMAGSKTSEAWKKCPTCLLLCLPRILSLYCKCSTCELEPFVPKCHPQTTESESPGIVVKNVEH